MNRGNVEESIKSFLQSTPTHNSPALLLNLYRHGDVIGISAESQALGGASPNLSYTESVSKNNAPLVSFSVVSSPLPFDRHLMFES